MKKLFFIVPLIFMLSVFSVSAFSFGEFFSEILGTSLSYVSSGDCNSYCSSYEDRNSDCSCSCTFNSDLGVYNTHRACDSGTAESDVEVSKTTSEASRSDGDSGSSSSTISSGENLKYKYDDGECHRSEPLTSLDCGKYQRLTYNLDELNYQEDDIHYCTLLQQTAGLCGGVLTGGADNVFTEVGVDYEEKTTYDVNWGAILPGGDSFIEVNTQVVPQDSIANPWVQVPLDTEDINGDGVIDAKDLDPNDVGVVEAQSLIKTSVYYEDVIVPTLIDFDSTDYECEVDGVYFSTGNEKTCNKLKLNNVVNKFLVILEFFWIPLLIMGLLILTLSPYVLTGALMTGVGLVWFLVWIVF